MLLRKFQIRITGVYTPINGCKKKTNTGLKHRLKVLRHLFGQKIALPEILNKLCTQLEIWKQFAQNKKYFS